MFHQSLKGDHQYQIKLKNLNLNNNYKDMIHMLELMN